MYIYQYVICGARYERRTTEALDEIIAGAASDIELNQAAPVAIMDEQRNVIMDRAQIVEAALERVETMGK